MALDDPVESSEQGSLSGDDGPGHEDETLPVAASAQPTTTTVPPAQAAQGSRREADVRVFTQTNPEFIDQTIVGR